MEKREARIKCSGCGTSYKIKVPVTDKPVSFKCKKCGKVLKIRLKPSEAPAAAPAPPAPSSMEGLTPGFESTQLPDSGDFYDSALPDLEKSPSFVENYLYPDKIPQQTQITETTRRWLMLSDDLIKGPFTQAEIAEMVHTGEITAGTSLRSGERPWVQASEIPDFRHFFSTQTAGPKVAPIDSVQLMGLGEETEEDQSHTETPFYRDFPAIVSYPVASGNPIPLVIFAGIAFAFSAVLSYELLVGFPLSILGWSLLYGYLSSLARQSSEAPDKAPPPWNFSQALDMVVDGLKSLAVLAVYCLIPVGICLVLMIAFFLNSRPGLGYVFLVLTVLIFAGSLLVVPAALVALVTTRNIGPALKPGNLVQSIRTWGHSYQMLALASVAIGLACMFAVIGAVFLAEIPLAGFAVAGLVMAVVLSYGHFVWFCALGRFTRDTKPRTSHAPATA